MPRKPQENVNTYKLGLLSIVLMIFTSVYGFVNISRAFYLMGYASIIWYLVAGLFFFLPYVLMMAEFGIAFSHEKGGIYTWMEKSVSPRYAFVVMFMLYSAYLIWMVASANYIWIPISTLFSGYDNTQSWVMGSFSYSQVLGILAVLWILVLTFFSASQGLTFISSLATIGAIAILAVNLLLILGAISILLLKGFQFAEPISGLSSFLVSPDPSYTSLFAILGFSVFSFYAYTGSENTGGLVDQMDKPEKSFPRVLFFSFLLLVGGYIIGIFLVGAFVNWGDVFGEHVNVNLANVVYVVMGELGLQLGQTLEWTPAGSQWLGLIFARLTALCMVVSYIGSFFILSYTPLRELIVGTPKRMWWGRITKHSKKDIPVYALWMQATIVIVVLLLVSFGGSSAREFFNLIVNLTNVAMTLPYAFLALSFLFFKLNDKIEKPFVIVKGKKRGIFISLTATISILFVVFLSILSPFLQGDIRTGLWMLGEPVFFALIALLIYQNYQWRERKAK